MYGAWDMRLIVIILILLLSTPAAYASMREQVRQGNELFSKKDWDGAIERYLNALEYPAGAAVARYNLGTAFYKKGNYDQAVEHLTKAAAEADKTIVPRAWYNAGNAFYKKSLSLEDKDLNGAVVSMEKAIDAYQQSLIAQPKDEHARSNREAAVKQLERLRKKQEEDKKNAQGKDNKQDQKQDQTGERSKDKGQGDQEDKNKGSDEDTQANQDKDQDDKLKEGHDDGSSQEKARSSQSKEEASSKQAEGKEPLLKEEHAKELLEDYERQEAPRGIIHFGRRQQGESHVERDW